MLSLWAIGRAKAQYEAFKDVYQSAGLITPDLLRGRAKQIIAAITPSQLSGQLKIGPTTPRIIPEAHLERMVSTELERRKVAYLRDAEIEARELETRLLRAQGPVSSEQHLLKELLDRSQLPNVHVSKRHLSDAVEQYVDGTKDHSSLGESRTLLQSVLDDISEEVNRTGKSPVKLPAGTSNRLVYLEKNSFLTTDETAAFGAAWGFLSAGSHPGLPPREQARIGLLLSIEFTQVLIWKWLDWRQRQGL